MLSATEVGKLPLQGLHAVASFACFFPLLCRDGARQLREETLHRNSKLKAQQLQIAGRSPRTTQNSKFKKRVSFAMQSRLLLSAIKACLESEQALFCGLLTRLVSGHYCQPKRKSQCYDQRAGGRAARPDNDEQEEQQDKRQLLQLCCLLSSREARPHNVSKASRKP